MSCSVECRISNVNSDVVLDACHVTIVAGGAKGCTGRHIEQHVKIQDKHISVRRSPFSIHQPSITSASSRCEKNRYTGIRHEVSQENDRRNG